MEEKMSEQENLPTSEEILESVKEENKNGDEREVQSMRKAQSIGMFVGILIAGVVMLVEAIVKGKIPFAVAAVLFLSEGVWYTVQGINVEHNKKLILICGITVTVYGLFMFVAWILELCGVIYR